MEENEELNKAINRVIELTDFIDWLFDKKVTSLDLDEMWKEYEDQGEDNSLSQYHPDLSEDHALHAINGAIS